MNEILIELYSYYIEVYYISDSSYLPLIFRSLSHRGPGDGRTGQNNEGATTIGALHLRDHSR